jgi:hypothetical protein
MLERRRTTRLKEENEVAITVISGRNNLPKEKRIYGHSEEVWASGAKIQTNILLPVDTFLKVNFKLNALQKKIKAVGKVKWVKVIIDDESYEAGVEFIAPSRKLANYIAWKHHSIS